MKENNKLYLSHVHKLAAHKNGRRTFFFSTFKAQACSGGQKLSFVVDQLCLVYCVAPIEKTKKHVTLSGKRRFPPAKFVIFKKTFGCSRARKVPLEISPF